MAVTIFLRRGKNTALFAAAFLLFSSTIISCSRSGAAPAAEPRGADAGFPLSFTDDLGREVTVRAKPERIVSLSPSLTEILFAIGAGDQVAGVTQFCDYPPEAQTRTVVGGFTGASVNIERVAELMPDIVFVSADMHEMTVEMLSRLGITAAAFEPRTFDDVFAAISRAGSITGNDSGAQAVIAGMRETIDRAGTLRGARPKPRLYWELSYDPIMTTGRDTWVNDAIIMAGGENVFGDLIGQYPTVSLEQIILKEPEWILVAEYGVMGTSAEAIRARSGWGNIPAVKNGKIGTVDADSLYRYGPRLSSAALQIAEVLFGK